MRCFCISLLHIYKKLYEVKYCIGCELEKTDSELVEGKCPIHPNINIETPSLICVLKWGIGNRIKCLVSSIILARYTGKQLYVIWTNHDMKNTNITDIWKEPYPFILLPNIPEGFELPISPEIEWEEQSIDCWQDRYKQCVTSGISNINKEHIDRQILFINGWWYFKIPQQSIDQPHPFKSGVC